jgi:hypothetical protein
MVLKEIFTFLLYKPLYTRYDHDSLPPTEKVVTPTDS